MAARILFLPGLDGLANSMENVQEHLRERELVPFSYPTGRDLDWDSLTSLVAARLKALETGLLAGESFGGAVALKTAILHKQSVQGLCLLGTFSEEPEAFAAALGRTATRILPRGVMKPVARILANWKLAGGLKGEKRERFLSRFENLDHAELARRLKLLKGFSVSDRLIGIHAKTDVLYGTEDPIAANRRQLELWRRIPDAGLNALDGYGHVICAEVPFGVARRMDGWARRAEGAHAEA